MRNILTTRRDFVRGCLFSAALLVSKNGIACLPLLDVTNYTMTQYSTDIALLGLEETWRRICDSLLVMGMPKYGICSTMNLPKLYQFGLEVSGRSDGHIQIDDSVSKVVANQLRLSECDSVCCVNGGICLSLVNALLANGSRKLVEDKRVMLIDRDMLAMRVCATIIAVNLGFSNISNILCDFSSVEDNIRLDRFSSVLAFFTENDDLLVRKAIVECQSAVIVTSMDVNNIVYPTECKSWQGSAMTFPEPRVPLGQLSLVTINKQHESREDDA